jgi:hypothetical protein
MGIRLAGTAGSVRPRDLGGGIERVKAGGSLSVRFLWTVCNCFFPGNPKYNRVTHNPQLGKLHQVWR